jgi:hypothetical protein
MAKKTENTKHAAGMKCPGCGSLGPFYIQGATCNITLDDDKGIIDFDEAEWVEEDACSCMGTNCDFSGTVGDFESNEDKDEDGMEMKV